jgi:hypothetical protein
VQKEEERDGIRDRYLPISSMPFDRLMREMQMRMTKTKKRRRRRRRRMKGWYGESKFRRWV